MSTMLSPADFKNLASNTKKAVFLNVFLYTDDSDILNNKFEIDHTLFFLLKLDEKANPFEVFEMEYCIIANTLLNTKS